MNLSQMKQALETIVAMPASRYDAATASAMRKVARDALAQMAAAKKPDLYVVLEGGLVSAIISDQEGVLNETIGALRAIDYDVEGNEPVDIGLVEQENGKMAEAIVSTLYIDHCAVGSVMTAAEARAFEAQEETASAPAP